MIKENHNSIYRDSFDYWIFDLDNTLYDIKLGLFKKVSQRITKYIINYFNISNEEALKLQREMYYKYGLTLRGLIIEKNIEPKDFLNFVHDVDFSELQKDFELKKLLTELKGKRYIYTNASYDHAKNILSCLDVFKEFDKIIDIKITNFIPKPNKVSYEIMSKKLGLTENHFDKAVFVEDTVKNLIPAKKLGMTTIWIENDFNYNEFRKNLTYIDYSFKNVKSFLKFIKK